MPIYEYQCTACGFQKEVLQKISDEPLKVCPKCGKETMQKMVSAAAFRLKGGGWYETDFKKGNKKNVVESGKSETAARDKPSDSKSASGSSGSTTTTTKSSKT